MFNGHGLETLGPLISKTHARQETLQEDRHDYHTLQSITDEITVGHYLRFHAGSWRKLLGAASSRGSYFQPIPPPMAPVTGIGGFLDPSFPTAPFFLKLQRLQSTISFPCFLLLKYHVCSGGNYSGPNAHHLACLKRSVDAVLDVELVILCNSVAEIGWVCFGLFRKLAWRLVGVIPARPAENQECDSTLGHRFAICYLFADLLDENHVCKDYLLLSIPCPQPPRLRNQQNKLSATDVNFLDLNHSCAVFLRFAKCCAQIGKCCGLRCNRVFVRKPRCGCTFG